MSPDITANVLFFVVLKVLVHFVKQMCCDCSPIIDHIVIAPGHGGFAECGVWSHVAAGTPLVVKNVGRHVKQGKICGVKGVGPKCFTL